MRLLSAASTTTAANEAMIYRLPDELLQVLHRMPLLPKDRKVFLLPVSCVSKRFRNLTLELLLAHPSVELVRIGALAYTFFQYPVLAKKTKALEITTSSFNPECTEDAFEFPARSWWMRICHFATTFRDAPDPMAVFNEYCVRTILASTLDVQFKFFWSARIELEDWQAYLALVLHMLPNLDTLLLGGSIARQQQLLATSHIYPNQAPSTSPWAREYLNEAVKMIAPKLRTLELPCGQIFRMDRVQHSDYGVYHDGGDLYNLEPRSVPCFKVFAHLAHLTVSLRALIPSNH